MAGHLKLLGLLFNLILGVVYLVVIFQRMKPSFHRFLLPLAVYTGGLVATLTGLFVTKYFDLNLSRNLVPQAQPLLTRGFEVLAYVLIIIMTTSVILISLSLQEETLPRWYKTFIGFSLCLLTITLALLSFLGTTSPLYPALHFIKENDAALFFMAELYFLFRLLKRSSSKANAGPWQKPARLFAILFIARYVMIVGAMTLAPPLLKGFSFMLILQGSSYLWFQYSLLPYLNRLEDSREITGTAAALARSYHLSERETEILALMLSGKNNREIEDLLFISYNTVKNHVYSIYKKTGAKNRFQLFQMLR